MEDSSQSRQYGVSLLVHRRKITADTAKSGDPSYTPEDETNPAAKVIRQLPPDHVASSE
jgi:hypothetical protein